MSEKIKNASLKMLDEIKAKYNAIVESRKKVYMVTIHIDAWNERDPKVLHGVTRVRKTLRYLNIYMSKEKIVIPLSRVEQYEVREIPIE